MHLIHLFMKMFERENELHVKVLKLQTENDDLKIRLKKFTDVTSTSSTVHVQNQADRTGLGPGRILSY